MCLQKFVTDAERDRMTYQNTSCMTSCTIRSNAYFRLGRSWLDFENECGFGR